MRWLQERAAQPTRSTRRSALLRPGAVRRSSHAGQYAVQPGPPLRISEGSCSPSFGCRAGASQREQQHQVVCVAGLAGSLDRWSPGSGRPGPHPLPVPHPAQRSSSCGTSRATPRSNTVIRAAARCCRGVDWTTSGAGTMLRTSKKLKQPSYCLSICADSSTIRGFSSVTVSPPGGRRIAAARSMPIWGAAGGLGERPVLARWDDPPPRTNEPAAISRLRKPLCVRGSNR
jgi:hypothetical protein